VKLLLLLITTINTYSQSKFSDEFAVQGGLSGGFEFNVATKYSYLNPSITYYELTSLNRNRAFLVGWIARLSTLYGRGLNYYTAPARLTRVEAIDTVSFGRISQTSLNLGIRAERSLGRLQARACVDLNGFSFLGRSRVGRVYSSTGFFNQTDPLGRNLQKPFQGDDAYQQASPTRFNVRLLGDLDRGMLITEVYTRVYLTSNVALKLGHQWLTTEVTLANRDQVADNSRFRNRASLP
jgi:hypothetical protein